MSDIIRLLPDSVANQIAAGEVVQRPASVVKELLENAIDAGGNTIELIIKDSGRTLVQVLDNGNGMSGTDARLCFERHATSKIREANDLYAIRTMGFRGEALASIAAVAQVELKTKQADDEAGTHIVIEASEVKEQTLCQCSKGTNIAVKNLFFNIPARRNFLKSDTVEFTHIQEEFFRVALINNSIAFSLYHNGKLIFKLEKGNFKQRITALFGSNYNQRLVPVEQNMDLVNIYGFICKPEFAKKTRGEQYFFTNGRFMKSSYFHHAINSAFEELLPQKNHPGYFLCLDVDPKTIDVNIHPTKTEVKFWDERAIYAVLRAAVKKSLGQFSIAPTLDFEKEQTFDIPPAPKGYVPKVPAIDINPDYNPFDKKWEKPSQKASTMRDKSNLQNWEKMFDAEKKQNYTEDFTQLIEEPAIKKPNEINELFIDNDIKHQDSSTSILFQCQNQYIVTSLKSGLVIIDQQRASERILYERFLSKDLVEIIQPQQKLFPQIVTFSPADTALFTELLPEVRALGYDIDIFGKNDFVINGTPADVKEEDIKPIMEELIESLKTELPSQKVQEKNQKVALAMAKSMSVKAGKKLSQLELETIVEQLFTLPVPEYTPSGKKIMTVLKKDDLEKLLN